jgi:uncharacterized protein (DUF1697 family)
MPAKKSARNKPAAELHRYAALLRGVSPMNAKMPELKAAFESAGFHDVRTVLGSGNVLFSSAASEESELEQRAEAAMQHALGRSFLTIVRSVDTLRTLLSRDPFASFSLRPGEKRVISFLRSAPDKTRTLPSELDGARILKSKGREVFTAYVPNGKSPVFMALIEKTFGKEITTRTWDTVKKLTV